MAVTPEPANVPGSDLPWIEATITRSANHMLEGHHFGAVRHGWSEDHLDWDDSPKIVGTQTTTITEGRLLGEFPVLGMVTYQGGEQPITEARIVEVGPVIWNAR